MSPATLELWQTEWCPASHRVRQRLTELGLAYVVRQVPVAREARAELVRATGQDSIPVLLAEGQIITGEGRIVSYLNTHFAEPPEAEHQHAKAARARRKELETACQELTTQPTH
jgi:glutathione S-transferase